MEYDRNKPENHGHAPLADQLNPRPHESQTSGNYLKSGYETWSCAWSPDGTVFAWSCGERIVKLIPWNRRLHRTLNCNDKEWCDAVRSNCSDHIELNCTDLVWSLAFGSPTHKTKAHTINLDWEDNRVLDVLYIATGLNNGRIKIWNARQGTLLFELCDHRNVIRDLQFAPDGSLRLASASRDGQIKMWDLKDGGNLYKTITADCQWVYSVAWSPNANLIAAVGDKQTLMIWNNTTQKTSRLYGHRHNICCCDFSPDGAILATASYDTSVILWDPYIEEKLVRLRHLHPTPELIYAGGANGAFVRGVSFSRDGRHIATISDDTYVRFWDIYDTSVPCRTTIVTNSLCCSYSPDGQVLAVGTRNGNVSIWRAPMTMNSLQHHCRLAIRRLLPSNEIHKIHLPNRLIDYILYKPLLLQNNNEFRPKEEQAIAM